MKNRIKERLKEMEKSQGWLARKAHFDRQYISKLANQRVSNPTIKNCLLIAEALNCLVEELWPLVKLEFRKAAKK